MNVHYEPRTTLLKVLLACGVLYSLLYVIVNDVVAATLYEGYSRTSQAVSELSATGAPTSALLTAMLPISTVLLMAFGIGVWKSADGKRALRVTGALLVAHGATFPLWLLAPMTSREEMGQTMPVNDIGHIALTAMTLLFIPSEIGFGAAAFGKRFRLYSLVTAATVLVFGALTGMQAPKVSAGEPTPWMGVLERISIAAWLLWLAVLAIILLRGRSDARGGVQAQERRAGRRVAQPMRIPGGQTRERSEARVLLQIVRPDREEQAWNHAHSKPARR